MFFVFVFVHLLERPQEGKTSRTSLSDNLVIEVLFTFFPNLRMFPGSNVFDCFRGFITRQICGVK
jgi:hypothetical protein